MSSRNELSDKDLALILKWWSNDYKEKLILQFFSWFKWIDVDLNLVRRLEDYYMKSMIYVVHLSDRLVSRGFRILYANFSWLELRNGRYGCWPDLLIGKNGKVGLVEVKSKLNKEKALRAIVGNSLNLRTNFVSEKRANYIGLAKELGVPLFLAYFDTNVNDWRFINIDNKILKMIEELKNHRLSDRENIFNRYVNIIETLTLDDLDRTFRTEAL